jgi:hypothetical protein
MIYSMKTYKAGLIIFAVLLLLVLVVWMLTLEQSVIDIQLHDTYFVIDKVSMAVLILGPFSFLIFLARAVALRFRSIGANIELLIGLILVALITYNVIKLSLSI